jgi:hypothetical protein
VPITKQKNTNIFQLLHCQQTQSLLDHAVFVNSTATLIERLFDHTIFCEWRKKQKTKGVDENINLTYVLKRSRSVKFSSLWCYFSQLKKMLLVKVNIEIGRFVQILIISSLSD